MNYSIKYSIEGNIDFYNEIANFSAIENDDITEKKCLITYEPLEKNSIELPCTHTFNYLPLYKELYIQKKTINTAYDSQKLLINEMKCPYCRMKLDKILPYMQIYDEIGNALIHRVNGVNSPERYCMKGIACEWISKKEGEAQTSGEAQIEGKAPTKCQKNAYYNLSKCPEHAYCNTHWQQQKEKKPTKKKAADTKTMEWTDEMEKFSKSKTIVELKKMLREKGYLVGGNKKQLVQRLMGENVIIVL